MYEGVANDLPIEALVARNMGDEDWEDLCVDPGLASGCSRKATYERDRLGQFEPEPLTIKDLTITRRRLTINPR